MIEPAVGDPVEDLVADRLLAPVAERHQQGSLGAGVELPDLGQQLAAGHARGRPAGQHQGDLDARGGKLREVRTRLRGRSHADHLIVPRVPIVQLAFDVAQQAFIVVDGKQDGLVHGGANLTGLRRLVNSVHHAGRPTEWVASGNDCFLAICATILAVCNWPLGALLPLERLNHPRRSETNETISAAD